MTPSVSISRTPSISITPSASAVANYSTLVGYTYTCSAGTVTSYAVYQNSNGAFGGNQFYRTENSTTYASNPSQSAPNTAATWVNNGATYCDGINRYQPQINNNPCHSPFGETQNAFVDNTSCLIPTSLQLSLDEYSIINSCGGTNTAQTWINKFTLLDQYGNVMNAISNITINMEEIESNCLTYNTYPYSITLLAGNSFILDNYYSYTGFEECPYDQACTQYIDATYYVSNGSGLAYIP
jgi:hypothetical protein